MKFILITGTIFWLSFTASLQAQTHTFERNDGYDTLNLRDLNWKMVFMTGDDSISAFDNARKKLKSMFVEYGVRDENIVELSRSRSQQTGGVLPTTINNFENAMNDFNVGPDDACAVFLTSHGSTSGFYIKGQNYLTPRKLDQILDDACGDRPTVALISACYSGVFVEPLAQPNRIILTAARKDRTSFGCSAEATYTYWDSCMISSLPGAKTWNDLYASVTSCIENKENRGGFKRSYPQGSFGENMQDTTIITK